MPISLILTFLCSAAINAVQIDTVKREDGSMTITIVTVSKETPSQDIIELFESDLEK